MISNRANGYRDLIASIDLATYRRIPWENNVPFFLVSFLDPDTKEPICADPRGVLRQIVTKAHQRGWRCIAGCEYEVGGLCNASNLLTDASVCSTFNSKVCTSPYRGFINTYLIIIETPHTLAAKKFTDLQPLTSGSMYPPRL